MKNSFSASLSCVPECFVQLSMCDKRAEAIIKDHDVTSFIFFVVVFLKIFLNACISKILARAALPNTCQKCIFTFTFVSKLPLFFPLSTKIFSDTFCTQGRMEKGYPIKCHHRFWSGSPNRSYQTLAVIQDKNTSPFFCVQVESDNNRQ